MNLFFVQHYLPVFLFTTIAEIQDGSVLPANQHLLRPIDDFDVYVCGTFCVLDLVIGTWIIETRFIENYWTSRFEL